MSYKITIQKNGRQAGNVTIETLDSTSCSTVQQISQQFVNVKSTSIDHGDDQPVHDIVQVIE